MSNYAFGVDIGGTSVKLGLFNGAGEMLDKWEIPTRKENHSAALLPDVAESLSAKMRERQIPPQEVMGVGVGVPGGVNEEGYLVNGAVNLGWGPFDLRGQLEEYVKLPVRAANDANTAAFGELWQGGGKGYRNLVMVTLGTGVGGGIIVDGRIVSGASGGGGEIGHIHVNDEETVCCACEGKGCLEQYASATGIARLARARLEKDTVPSVLRSVGEVTAKEVFDAVKAGDKVAVEIAEQFGDYLGKGLAAVAAVVNPEVFVVGGGVSKAGDLLFQYIEEPFQKYVFKGCKNAKFVLAALGNDAGIYGAAGLFLNSR